MNSNMGNGEPLAGPLDERAEGVEEWGHALARHRAVRPDAPISNMRTPRLRGMLRRRRGGVSHCPPTRSPHEPRAQPSAPCGPSLLLPLPPLVVRLRFEDLGEPANSRLRTRRRSPPR